MSFPKVGNVAGAGAPAPLETGKEKFGQVLQDARNPRGSAGAQAPSEVAPRPVVDQARSQAAKPPGVTEARGVQRAQAAATPRAVEAAKVLDQVSAAQQRLDQILAMAQGGKSFSPAELIAMQAHVYRASQELDLAGKVVEKATGGVKQILQTQV